MANSPNDTRFKSPGQNEPSLADVETRLKLIQLQRLEREEAAIEEEIENQKKSRQAGIDSVRQKMASEKQKQASCSHLKENGRTQLAGQKDHSGIIHLICQNCQKHWRGNEIPPGLFPTGDGSVGGPH